MVYVGCVVVAHVFLCGVCRVCGCGPGVLVWCLESVWLWLVFLCGVCRVCGCGWCSCVVFVGCVVMVGVLVRCL